MNELMMEKKWASNRLMWHGKIVKILIYKMTGIGQKRTIYIQRTHILSVCELVIYERS